MIESRAAQRHRVLKVGLIEFSGGGAIPCAVKNLSASGAALQVESAVDIPNRLTLAIPAAGAHQAAMPRCLAGPKAHWRVI
jgi:hypothetical protein